MKKIVLYTSNACGKCKIIKPQIDELLKNRDDIEYILYSTDKKDGFSSALDNNVYSLPTLIFFENEKEAKRLVSSFDIDDVRSLIA